MVPDLGWQRRNQHSRKGVAWEPLMRWALWLFPCLWLCDGEGCRLCCYIVALNYCIIHKRSKLCFSFNWQSQYLRLPVSENYVLEDQYQHNGQMQSLCSKNTPLKSQHCSPLLATFFWWSKHAANRLPRDLKHDREKHRAALAQVRKMDKNRANPCLRALRISRTLCLPVSSSASPDVDFLWTPDSCK